MSMDLFLAATNGSSSIMLVVWIVVLFAFMYFFMIRPQQNETKKKDAMMKAREVGDTVLTTSGFYGVVIAMEDDTVIVEFGSNKNCRIPMQKSAISAVEKPEDAVASETKADADATEEKTEKKGLFGKKKD